MSGIVEILSAKNQGNVRQFLSVLSEESEVPCSARSGTYFLGNYEIYFMVISSLPQIKEWQLSVTGESMGT